MGRRSSLSLPANFIKGHVSSYTSSSVVRTSSTTTTTANSKNFIVLGSSEAYSDLMKGGAKKVLYFTASWCPPCKMIAPVFSKLSAEYKDILFVKIDIDEYGDVASEHSIQSVPTFEFINGDKVVDKVRYLITTTTISLSAEAAATVLYKLTANSSLSSVISSPVPVNSPCGSVWIS